jgi:hypothetical protein
VDAVDPDAAAAYAHLAAISTESVRPEYAWLYCRAAQLHGYTSDQDLQLFAKTFRDEASARAFYTARQWDMEEIAYTYLERCAAQRPGSFPAEFGPNYPQRGEAMLLERSARLEASGQPDAALATAEVLHQLAPHSLPAHDHLARLHYRRGALERAAELLATWEQLAPANHQPAVRRAIIEQQRGNNKERSIAIRRALESSHGSQRAAIAFLGARLSLSVLGRPPSSNGQAEQQEIVDWDEAKELLLVCLQEAPDHAEALSWLAAVRVVNGDQSGLAEQALRMDRPDVAEPHFHYLAAVCHLAAEDYARVLQAGRRALGSADAALAVECEYVMGWAHWRLGDPSTAAAAFEKLAQEPSSPSAEYARAAAASLAFQRGDYKQAARWWQAVHPRWRSEWGLDEPLRQTVFLSGLLAHSAGQYEEAADRLQEADRLGLRDRRIGPLLILNLVKAGQALLSGAEEEPAVYPVIQD